MLFLSLKDEQQTDAVMEKINRTYPNLLAARSGELSKSFLPIKNIAYFSQIISYITLVIASAVALMTFIMAISERTKEIGILQAIGWSRKMILGVFLTESLLIAWVSGAIGFILSYPGIYLLQKSISVYIYLASSPDLSIFANVLGMCTLLGIVSVLFPALYGTRISASKALRYE